MNSNTDSYRPGEDEDPRLLAAAQEYLAALEAGRRPARTEFLARFPELAESLPPYLDAIDMVHAGARVLPASGNRPVLEDPLPAEPLGDFRLVREIGRGGMGVVYEAVQLSLGRRVALKVLSFAATLDAKQLQRFHNEAQAAAQLHHTNIVPVFAVGRERGVHYYAMQLIEGQNLGELIGRLRSSEPSSGQDRPAAPASATVANVAAELSTQRASRSGSFYRTAARLAAQAADALEHAHQLGVIHRDVKPGNLMIDGRGSVWVTDFGLAQFHTTTGLTRTGDLLGTLRYMSPEQAGGQNLPVDPRTDVYSLGATLYELLTLQPMFTGTDQHQLLRQILEEEPRPPRALVPSIPAELETVVLKAVSKNPAERYDSAREFAEDLRRFLDHVPIRARRPTVAMRVRKWGRRHPSVVVAGVVLLFLVTAGSLLTAGLVRAEQEKTKQALEGQTERAEIAEKRLKMARQSVDDLVQVSETWLADMPHLTGLRRELLGKALKAYSEFLEEQPDNPAAQQELRETRVKVASIINDLAALEGALKLPVLGNPAVQDDLRLGDEQRARVKQLSERLDKKRRETADEFLRLSDEERRQVFLRDAHAIDNELNAILNDRQSRRLHQIALQLEGPGVFREPEVISALQLTAEQRSRIHDIEARIFFAPMDGKHPPEPGAGPRREPGHFGPRRDHNREQQWEQARAQILDLLTPDQKQRWQELTGEPFNGPRFPLCPPSPGLCEPPH